MMNDRICSWHHLLRKLTALLDDANPDWLLLFHLGHKTSEATISTVKGRYERRKAGVSLAAKE